MTWRPRTPRSASVAPVSPRRTSLGRTAQPACRSLQRLLAWGRVPVAAQNRTMPWKLPSPVRALLRPKFELLQRPQSEIVVWRPRDTACTESIFRKAPPAMASLIKLNGELLDTQCGRQSECPSWHPYFSCGARSTIQTALDALFEQRGLTSPPLWPWRQRPAAGYRLLAQFSAPETGLIELGLSASARKSWSVMVSMKAWRNAATRSAGRLGGAT